METVMNILDVANSTEGLLNELLPASTTFCRDVNQINYTGQCEFIRMEPDCQSDIGYVDYIGYMYCSFGPGGSLKAVGIGIIWLLVLFVGLGVTANDFLCPALFVISKNLKLSQNVAGVTLLAFGNGAPDIFAALAGIQQGKTNLVIGGLVGAGIFVTTVVAGSIFVIKPFRMMKRPFIRDVSFYLIAGAWVFYLFYTGSIQIYHAFGFIALYLLYIIVVVVSRMVYQRSASVPEPEDAAESKEAEASAAEKGNGGEVQAVNRQISFRGKKAPEDNPEAVGIVLKSYYFYNNGFLWDDDNKTPDIQKINEFEPPTGIYVITYPNGESVSNEKKASICSKSGSICSVDNNGRKVSVTSCEKVRPEDEEEVGEVRTFLEKVCPVDLEGWSERSVFDHIVELIKAPVLFMITLTVPVIDYRTKLDNWCKSLNMMHLITGPFFALLGTGNAFVMLGGVVPLAVVVLVVSIILALAVQFTSQTNKTPVYHSAFAYLGFVVSVVWIYIISIEIVVLLQAIGVVFNLSDTLIGLTILAWGNCLLDFMSNISVAKKGFPRMGVAACFGSPFLTLLIGVGVPCVIKLLGNLSLAAVPLDFTPIALVLFVTLAISLLSTLATMLVTSFHAKRPLGLYLIALYFVFLITSILVEVGVIA